MLNENLIESFSASRSCQHWDLEAFSDYRGQTLTYADVAHRILQLHAIFADAGVERGDKIAVVGRNSAHWAVTYWATLTYGGVIVPVLPDFTGEEIHHIVGHSDSVLLFVSDPIYDKLDDSAHAAPQGHRRLEDFRLCVCLPEGSAEQVYEAAEFQLPRASGDPPHGRGLRVRPGARHRSGLHRLHQRHHRLQQGRHAQSPQPHGELPLLRRRPRPGSAIAGW